MEQLIPIINELQDVFNRVGTNHEIQLPRFTVVGAQSVGKSSVLEAIVQKEFLPRGTGIVTRTPLELRLIQTMPNSPIHLQKNVQAIEWAEFDHTEKVFIDFMEVKQEIIQQTNKLAGSGKNISMTPIRLTIYSPKVVNLTLIDLPGLIKVKIGDQPDDIKNQIEQMVLSYIEDKNTLIIAVSQATSDLANSEAIEIARRPNVDPHGERTLVVLTQLDLMNPGTDARAILQGQVIPMKLGIIGVKNRTQKDIDDGKSMNECMKEERAYFRKHYPDLADVNGIEYLTQRLKDILMRHINECLPRLNLEINEKISQTAQRLEKLKKPVESGKKNVVCTQILEQFVQNFRKAIAGNAKRDKLSRGARMWYIFINHFKPLLDAIDPINLEPQEVLTAIRNITGPHNAFFLPDQAYAELVKDPIEGLKVLCLECAQMIYDEMIKAAQECYQALQNDTAEIYPNLVNHTDKVVKNLIINQKAPTEMIIKDLVDVQKNYINTDHTDFQEGKFLKMLSDPKSRPATENGEQDGIERKVAVFIQKLKGIHMVESGSPHASFCDKELTFEAGNRAHANTMYYNNVGSSSLRSDDILEELPEQHTSYGSTNPFDANDESTTRPLTEKQESDCLKTVLLMHKTFSIVRKTVEDLVPKMIMKKLVYDVLDKLHGQLINELILNFDDPKLSIDELLQESHDVKIKRNKEKAMLDALEEASDIVNKIQFPKWEESDANSQSSGYDATPSEINGGPRIEMNQNSNGFMKRRVPPHINSDPLKMARMNNALFGDNSNLSDDESDVTGTSHKNANL